MLEIIENPKKDDGEEHKTGDHNQTTLINLKENLRRIVGLKGIAVFVVVAFFSIFATDEHCKFGPRPDFVVLSAIIDTWFKYWTLMAMILFLLYVHEMGKQIAKPLFMFTVYNPNCSEIEDISRNELWGLAVAYKNFDVVLDGLGWIIIISSVDIVFLGLGLSIVVSSWNINQLLSLKKFK